MKSPSISLRVGLFAAASLAAFVAAADPVVRTARAPILRVLVHDASASCGARESPDDEEMEALLGGLGRGDLAAVVTFGADARTRVPPCPPSQVRASSRGPAVDAESSALGAALRHAAGLAESFPVDARNRFRLEVVLATDGLATDGRDAVHAGAARLRSAGCASLRVLRRRAAPSPSTVAELRGPGAARVGEPFSLEARGVAADGVTMIELSDASGAVESRSVGGPGPFRLMFTRIEETAGPATFTARAVGPMAVPAATARVAVVAPGRALVVGDGAPRAELQAALGPAADWCDTKLASAARLAAHDVVVVDDVPGARLSALEAALTDLARGGGGVLLLGGPHSFGAGGWAGRPIERISPLVARPRGETGTYIYLALDASGSMAEAWSDAPGAATRDAVARQAARSLVASAADDTSIAIRRFAADLGPDVARAPVFLAGSGAERARAEAVIDAFPAPGGATALLPPLRDALSTAATRHEKRKQAILLTDGRTAESAADLHDALAALDAAGVRVGFVLPGYSALDDQARPLAEALRGTRAEVHGAAAPEQLARAFRDLEEKARVGEPIVTDRRLAVAPDGVAILPIVPEIALRVDRAWLAEGATLLVSTDRGEPVAASRRVGLGVVSALATRPFDEEWLPSGERTAATVRSLARAVARRAAARTRVERDGERLLVRQEPSVGGESPKSVAWRAADGGRLQAPLVRAEEGLLAADLGRLRGEAPAWFELVADGGRVVATVGLDEPAPPERRDPAAVDLDAVSVLASNADAPTAASLAPWPALASVALALAALAAARIKSSPPHAR